MGNPQNEGFSETVEDRIDENAIKKKTLKADNQEVTLEVFDTQGTIHIEIMINITSRFFFDIIFIHFSFGCL